MRTIWKKMKSNKKETMIFSSTMLLAVILFLCMALNIPIPSPTLYIGNLLEPIVKPIALWLKGDS
ncbi:hypothetical protein EHS13_24855 [Paenibacillus psychroresistens]|uniref:Uncharacterized protein n=1 Tax=Paenibacillus psychroresistens TaxID=1778678 RepID=A0A6B8RQR6_9BACL|nr:hypothetical protein [Paenibacillus psychroresistens]QGQ97885.1 hypothetical protein EHS13_24855 [Paenibacillus psychroresistens]